MNKSPKFDIVSWNTSRSLWQLPVSSASEREKSSKGAKEVHIVTDKGVEAFISYAYRQLRWLDRTTLFAFEALYTTKWNKFQLKTLFDGFYEKRLNEVKHSRLANKKGSEAITAEAEYLALLDLSDHTEIRVTYADLAEVIRRPRGVEEKHARDGSYISDSVKALALTTLGQGTHTMDGQGKTRYWSSPVPLLRVKIGADLVGPGSIITGDVVVSLNAFHLRSILEGNAHQQEIRLVMSIRSPLAGHIYCYLRSALWKSSKEAGENRAPIVYSYQDFARYAQIMEYRRPNEIKKQLREAYEELIEKGLSTGFEVIKAGARLEIEHHMDPKYLDNAMKVYKTEELPAIMSAFEEWQYETQFTKPESIKGILQNVEWIVEYRKTKNTNLTKEKEARHELDQLRYLRWFYVRRVAPKTYVRRVSGKTRGAPRGPLEKESQLD